MNNNFLIGIHSSCRNALVEQANILAEDLSLPIINTTYYDNIILDDLRMMINSVSAILIIHGIIIVVPASIPCNFNLI